MYYHTKDFLIVWKKFNSVLGVQFGNQCHTFTNK